MRAIAKITAVLLVGAVAACERGAERPDTASPTYTRAVAAFYTGVAAAQAGESGLANAAFRRVTEAVPQEPAAWADLGLVALQRGEVDVAVERMERARSLAPENGRIQLISALVERERGRLERAAEHLRRAVELDARDLRALHLLAQIVEQEDRPGGLEEAERLVDRILALEPSNLAALIEHARLAAKRGDGRALRTTLDRIQAGVPDAHAALGERVGAVRSAAAAGDFGAAAAEIAFLGTELQELSRYRDDRRALVVSPHRAELLLTAFVRLPVPSGEPAPADTGLAFAAEPLSAGAAPRAWVRALWVGEGLPLALITANRDSVWIGTGPERGQTFAFPGAADAGSPAPSAAATLDYDYDFRVDVALAGAGGLRLLRQNADGSFDDVTADAVPSALARGAYAGAWAADLDMEGDIDLVLARVDGEPVALRNRGDGGFEPRPVFEGVTGLRDFVWADLDADGDPDASLLDAEGRLHVFLNRRHRTPQFTPRPTPDTLGPVSAIAAADANRDAVIDLLLLESDGALGRLSLRDDRWERARLARSPGPPPAAVGSARLFAADLDNNGAQDVVLSAPAGTRVWLSTEDGFEPHASLDFRITEVVDLTGEGRLDLIGVSPGGEPFWLANSGALDYFATSIRPRAAGVTGDRRVNAFGIGGELEVRSGLLYQKRLIDGPTVHVGLGENQQVDVARILWPNGSVQAEFNLAATNQALVTRQRLKGSCPWVFTFDGERMRFVTDFLWRTALGLRINAQGNAAVIHGEDWIRIRGDQLVARDGFYDVRITGELWETHFFDHVALLVVDHPADTEAFVDERFTLPAPEPTVRGLRPLRAIARARDHRGRDVTALVRERDGRYLDTFELGPYQGIAEDHWVEIAIGEDAPTDGPLWLVASGWVYPTDSSINLAVAQGEHPRPRGVRLEVADGRGGWSVVEPDLGFPAGKTKTMLIDLRDVFRPGAPRRVRLRTNMEIYWDRIAWAAGDPGAAVETRRLAPAGAELRYRGFSAVSQASRAAPELPDYHTIAAVTPQWRDLVGYHTRFGDVRPLIDAVDDRYIIMNAGDELVLRFPEQPPPPAGWTRDFVLIGDGWVKDGDYNTGFSTTVRPLPYHGLDDYSRPPGRLEDDPAYQRHPEDWKIYHTRYVTSRDFHHALVPDTDD